MFSGRRRRSSLFQSLSSLASVALVSAMGSAPPHERDNVSSSSESEDELPVSPDSLARSDSVPSTLALTLSPEPEDVCMEIEVGRTNQAFTFNELDVTQLQLSNVSTGGQSYNLSITNAATHLKHNRLSQG